MDDVYEDYFEMLEERVGLTQAGNNPKVLVKCGFCDKLFWDMGFKPCPRCGEVFDVKS